MVSHLPLHKGTFNIVEIATLWHKCLARNDKEVNPSVLSEGKPPPFAQRRHKRIEIATVATLILANAKRTRRNVKK